MKTTIKIVIHENYLNVVIRFHKQTMLSHVEYSLCGANVIPMLRGECNITTFRRKVAKFSEEFRDVRLKYLRGFQGYFEATFEVINNENVTEWAIIDSRLINPSRGGRSVNGGFRHEKFGARILANLLDSAAAKDVEKLNGVMEALYTIGD